MAPTPANHFQVQLGGGWKDYDGQEDRILKRAYLAGFPNAKYTLRGHRYETSFARMTQKNVTTGKERQIRPPYTWKGKAPSAPVMEAGPTFCVKVPEGSAGTTIHVPHPKAKGIFIPVQVPATAKAGQTMLVPLPPAAEAPSKPVEPQPEVAAAAPAAAAPTVVVEPKKGGWSTGAKVAAGLGVAGAAVGGVVLGAHIAEDGWDATFDTMGDGLADAGEGLGDGLEAAADWVGGAGEDIGEFVTDLF